MTPQDKIIKQALDEVSYKESPPNSNKTKYGEWFGLNKVSWCGIFISWVYDKAGFNLGNIGYIKGFAGCQTAVKHFTETREITTTPQKGDIVFYDWDGKGKYVHAGIYYYKEDEETFHAVEGNTSLQNQSNGGEVMERLRKFENAIFVHPIVLDL